MKLCSVALLHSPMLCAPQLVENGPNKWQRKGAKTYCCWFNGKVLLEMLLVVWYAKSNKIFVFFLRLTCDHSFFRNCRFYFYIYYRIRELTQAGTVIKAQVKSRREGKSRIVRTSTINKTTELSKNGECNL